jgi:formylglycine-generating enzyme required for sulfatase activity
MKLALVPAGSFWMGSPATEAQRSSDEGPRTKVLLSRPFYLGVYPVTQREYAELMGSNPSHFTAGRGGGPDHPVENVSWKDAARFCRQLALLTEELVPGWGYRLPTEAEWEYACRAGTESAFAFGDSLSWEQANIDGRHPYGGARKGPSLGRTSRVGAYPANGWGLCDLHGNVWEWCADWYEAGYSGARLGTDPQGPPTGEARVLRGGAWNCGGRRCRSACRCPSGPDFRSFAIGFRVVLAP